MIKQQLEKMWAYNEWAWQRVFPSVAQLDDAAYKLDRGFFWGSLHGMLAHCFSAEWIWPLRLQGISPSALKDPGAFDNFAALRTEWDPARAALGDYIRSLTEADLAAEYSYRDTSGVGYAATVADTLTHVFLHSAEHRGQITPLLFNLGVPTQPLDHIFFARRQI